MTQRVYRQDPLTPEEREQFEGDLISFSDDELDLLGDLRRLDVLYAGGSSPLWIEGLSQRIGSNGTVTALDLDAERVEDARGALSEADLPAPVRLVAGNVFSPPFDPGSFDLVYSAGLFHELDVGEGSAGQALAALVSLLRPGGRLATSDFVDSVPATALEDEDIQTELVREVYGRLLFGVGPPERLVSLHERLLADVRWRISPPRQTRHLDRLVLDEDEPPEISRLEPEVARRLRRMREALRNRIEREGYTRPATLYVEGRNRDALQVETTETERL